MCQTRLPLPLAEELLPSLPTLAVLRLGVDVGSPRAYAVPGAEGRGPQAGQDALPIILVLQQLWMRHLPLESRLCQAVQTQALAAE